MAIRPILGPTPAETRCKTTAVKTATSRIPQAPNNGLLNFLDEEANCYSCHNGNVASKNLQREFNKTSIHPVLNTAQVHDPTEDR